jgi:iron complex transport system substrate-binding protein
MPLRLRILAAFLCTLGIACGSQPEQPDPAAAEPDTFAQRIVSVVPATTEILFAVGAGDRVVGVGSYDRFPSDVENLPRVGGLMDPNAERILALEPDLVVLYATQTALRQQLERVGIPYYAYEHEGLGDVMETVRQLGRRVGAAQAADELAAGMERDLDAIRQEMEGRPRPSVLLVFGRDPGGLRNVYASGGYGFLADILEIAGGDNVFRDVDRQSVQVGTEQMLSLAPEVIIELQYEGTDSDLDARRPEDWRALPALPAVRNGRVHVLRGDEFVVPGPRVVDAARRIAAALAL